MEIFSKILRDYFIIFNIKKRYGNKLPFYEQIFRYQSFNVGNAIIGNYPNFRLSTTKKLGRKCEGVHTSN